MKQENYIKGMIMIILSAFFFACMNVSVRLAGDLPSVEKSFFRNLVAAVFAAAILCKNRTVPKVDKKYWGPLILRCVCGTLGILCNFYAIDHLLVADASILNKLSPFLRLFFIPFVKGKDQTGAGCVCCAGVYRMFICSETGISECGTCSGTDRSLRWTGGRNCLYDGACTGNSRSEGTGYRVLFFIFLLFVGCAVDVVPFHTHEYEAACDIADGRIIRSGWTVYDYGCIHLCTCREDFHF